MADKPATAAAADTEGVETIEDLPKHVLARLDALKRLQEEYDNIQKEWAAERIALEKKYRAKYAPLYTQRCEVVNARLNPADVDVKLAEGAPASQNPAAGAEDTGVTGFWLQAMANHEICGQLITQEDEPALAYLTDVRVEDVDDCKGFALVFHFAPNPYFTNSELTKSYSIPNMYSGTEPNVEDVKGTEIAWKKGKNLTVKQVKAKPKGKNKGKGKGGKETVTEEPCESFFNFFSSPLAQINTDGTGSDIEEQLYGQLDADLEIGLAIRDKIVPNAYRWFTGEAVEDGFDIGEDGEEDDEDEDDEDDDDEEHHGHSHAHGRHGHSHGRHGHAHGGDDDEDDDEEDDDDEGGELNADEMRQMLAQAFKPKAGSAPAPAAAAASAPAGAQPAAPGAVEKPAECQQQ